ITKEDLWTKLDQKIRNSINKAQADLKFEIYDDIGLHYEIVQQTFVRAKIKHPVDRGTYVKIYQNLKPQSKAKLLYIKDLHNKVLASLLLICDAKMAYFISHGTILNAHRGATSFLLWNAILYAKDKNLSVDFEGSDLERIEYFYRKFGGELVPYYQIVKTKNMFWKMALTLLNKI
ncbi:MAG TPA: hypothetical protein PKD85_13905, partial [Saprospiraceae bacterium]|nr:hypothetical protein [Saprospiraceae bacterium]